MVNKNVAERVYHLHAMGAGLNFEQIAKQLGITARDAKVMNKEHWRSLGSPAAIEGDGAVVAEPASSEVSPLSPTDDAGVHISEDSTDAVSGVAEIVVDAEDSEGVESADPSDAGDAGESAEASAPKRATRGRPRASTRKTASNG